VFDDLTAAERRQVLLASRIRFTPEVKIPRQRAIEKMIETALFVAPKEHWWTATDVIESFKQIAGLQTLQVQAVIDGLDRLAERNRVEVRKTAPQYTYRLLLAASKDISHEFDESSSRLDRVLTKLYGGVIGSRTPQSMAPFFLELMCDFFSHLGSQWANYIGGEHSRSPVAFEAADKTLGKKIEKFKFDEKLRPDIARRTLHFFQVADPDFDYLKFSLGQSFYVARLLGMEGKDYLSKEIFADKTLYLDSSVVIPALLGSSRHYEVFRDLQKVCKLLRIKLCVTRPTVDEIRRVAASQEQEASTLYERVPASLNDRVRGDFFHAYAALKRTNPSAVALDVFKPFHELTDTIRATLGAEIVDDASFEKIPDLPNFEKVKDAFQEASESLRHLTKRNNALTHDAVVFLFLDGTSSTTPDRTWMVTRDVSLPRAWSKLQPTAICIRAFLLDGLLQCISPFIVEGDVKSFSELFSEAITTQFLPQSRLFDIDDFMLFQDIEMDCTELTDEEVQEALLRVKQHVLHGASYRHEDLGPAAYELRRFFIKRKERYELLTAERQRLEAAIAALEKVVEEGRQQHSTEISGLKEKHATEVGVFEKRLADLEEREKHRMSKRKGLLSMLKKIACLSVLIAIEWYIGKAALKFGAGDNRAMRIASFSFYLALGAVAWLTLTKLLFFRKDQLRDVFPALAEIKDLSPWG
jgi:hypothetical protein